MYLSSKKQNIKLTFLTSAVLFALNSQISRADITLTFTDNTNTSAYPSTINNPGSGVPFTTAFAAGYEFRMVSHKA